MLLIIALFLIVLLIISMFIKYVRKNKDFRDAIKSKSGRPLFILLVITIISFLAAIIVTLEYTVEDLFTNSNVIAGEYFTMVSSITICYRLGRLSMTSLFLFCLHISLKGSAMEISTKKIIYPLALCIVLSFITGSISSILSLCNVSDAFAGPTDTVAALRCVAFSMDLVVNALILYLFIHKLWNITMMGANELTISKELTMKDVHSVTIQRKIRESAKINPQQIAFLRTMTKNTNLAIWGIVSSLIPETLLVTAAWTMTGDKPDVDGLIISVFFRVDGVINSFCAYLLFSYAKDDYRRLCRYCDGCLSRCCTVLVQKRIARSQIHEFEKMHDQQIKSQQMKTLSPRLIQRESDAQIVTDEANHVGKQSGTNL